MTISRHIIIASVNVFFLLLCLNSVESFMASRSTFFSIPTRNNAFTSSRATQLRYRYDEYSDEDRKLVETVNGILRASRASFKHVESYTDFLLNKQPLVAMMIFVGAGLMVAYMSGFFFLDGYIDSWNPVDNDAVPYWDETILPDEFPSTTLKE